MNKIIKDGFNYLPTFLHKHSDQIHFLLLASFLFVAFQIIYFSLVIESPQYSNYLGHLAFSAEKLLNAIGQPAATYGTQIKSLNSNDYVVVVEGCDALLLFSTLVAAMLAYPATLRQKIVGLALGLSMLYMLNILRIAGMLWVEIHHPDLFDVFHYYLFSLVLWLAIMIIFVMWSIFIVINSNR